MPRSWSDVILGRCDETKSLSAALPRQSKAAWAVGNMVFAMDRSAPPDGLATRFGFGVTPSRVRYASPAAERPTSPAPRAAAETLARPTTHQHAYQHPQQAREAVRSAIASSARATYGPNHGHGLMSPRTAQRVASYREYAFNMRHREGLRRSASGAACYDAASSASRLSSSAIPSHTDRAAATQAKAEVAQAARRRWIEQQLATNPRAFGYAPIAREEVGGTAQRHAIEPPTRPERTGSPAVPMRAVDWFPTCLDKEHANRLARRAMAAPTANPAESGGRWSAASGDGSTAGPDGVFRPVRHFTPGTLPDARFRRAIPPGYAGHIQLHVEHDAPPRAFKVSNGDAPGDRPPVEYTRGSGLATPRGPSTPRDARWANATTRHGTRGGVPPPSVMSSASAASAAAVRV